MSRLRSRWPAPHARRSPHGARRARAFIRTTGRRSCRPGSDLLRGSRDTAVANVRFWPEADLHLMTAFDTKRTFANVRFRETLESSSVRSRRRVRGGLRPRRERDLRELLRRLADLAQERQP